MSLLPNQILPPSAPVGRVNPDGTVSIDKGWWLLLYNLCNQILGEGNATTNTGLLLADTLIDEEASDVAVLHPPISNNTLLAVQDALPLTRNDIPDIVAALMLAQDAYTTDPPVSFQSLIGKTPIFERPLFCQTATVAVANTVTETTLIGAGTGSMTLPDQYGVSGKTILLEGWGIHSATGNPTIQIRIYKGSTLLLDTGAVTSGNSTNNLVQFRAQITWRSTTSVFAQGFYQESGGGSNNFQMVNTAATTVNTTAEALKITATWGTAAVGNSISLTNLCVREAPLIL